MTANEFLNESTNERPPSWTVCPPDRLKPVLRSAVRRVTGWKARPTAYIIYRPSYRLSFVSVGYPAVCRPPSIFVYSFPIR
jgi:hypothetical protein